MNTELENDKILEVNDNALIVTTMTSGGRSLKARLPLAFALRFDQKTQTYETEGPFDIVSGAKTRRELEENLEAELAMLWKEYAIADPATLTPAAQRLRVELLDAFEETANAA